MISTVHIPLYSRYSPIISLSYLFYIPITLPVIFSVLLVVFPNLPFLGGRAWVRHFSKEDALPAPVPLHFLEAEIGGRLGDAVRGWKNPAVWPAISMVFPSVVVVFGGSSPRRKGLESRTPRVFGVSRKYMLETLRFGCWDSWVFTSTYLNDFYFWKVLFHKVDQDFLWEAWTIQKKVGLFFVREYSKCMLLKKIILKYSIMQYRDPNVVLHQFSFLSNIKFPLSKSLLRNKVVSLLRRQRARRCRGCPAHRDAFRAFSWLAGSFGTKQSFWQQRGGHYVAWSQVLLGSDAKDVMKPIA